MIYFRCEQCDGAVRADEASAGRSIPCARCGHHTVCPRETTGTSLLTSPRPTGGTGRPAGPRRAAAPAPGSPISIGRIATGLLVIGSIGWAIGNVMLREPRPDSPPVTAAPETEADRRQAEILKTAIDYAPDPALVRAYDEINTRHFAGRLPSIPVVWEPRLAEVGALAAEAFTLEGMFGHIGDRTVILLNPTIAQDRDALRRALCHEMVHAWLHTIGDTSTTHGPAFQMVLERLANEGAFAGIVASPEEREALRVWIDAESARLEAEKERARMEDDALAIEARAIERTLADMNARQRGGSAVSEASAEAWTLRRDDYNRRVAELRAMAERMHADAAAFNEQVERYNLMLSYPDGLDGDGMAASR